MVAFQSARKALDCAIAIQKALQYRNRDVGARHSAPRPGSDEPPDDPDHAANQDDVAGASPLQASGPGQTPAEPIHVRIGLHAGEVIKEGEDFFGRNVILAARVASQANGREILVSSVLKALLAGTDATWGDRRTAELKGLPGEHEIWSVNWQS
jgi:class 3 adenylate cyclase